MRLWQQSRRLQALAAALTLPACASFKAGTDEDNQARASLAVQLERQLDARLSQLLSPGRGPAPSDLPHQYGQGVAWGRIDIALRGLLAERGPVPAVSVHEMMARWQGQYVAWKGRSLCDEDLRYLWADGFHLKGGLAGGRSALLVLAGGLRDGRIIILDLETGPMDASEPWKAMLRNLKKRGLREPALCVAPADLGVWPAVREAFPGTQRQWCWNHVVDSVLVRLPAGLREAAQIELRGMAAAGCESEARRKKQRFCAQHVREWPEAIETLDQAWSHLVRLYRFPLRQREILANTAVIGSPLVALQLLNGGSRAGSGTPNTMAAIWKLLRVAEAGFPKLERVKPSSDWAVPGPVLASRVDVGR